MYESTLVIVSLACIYVGNPSAPQQWVGGVWDGAGSEGVLTILSSS